MSKYHLLLPPAKFDPAEFLGKILGVEIVNQLVQFSFLKPDFKHNTRDNFFSILNSSTLRLCSHTHSASSIRLLSRVTRKNSISFLFAFTTAATGYLLLLRYCSTCYRQFTFLHVGEYDSRCRAAASSTRLCDRG
jgi:hypothetical protein